MKRIIVQESCRSPALAGMPIGVSWACYHGVLPRRSPALAGMPIGVGDLRGPIL